MDILGILGILLGILTIILFIIKKFNIIIAAPIATIVVLLFNEVPILETVFGKENSYMTALAGFVASNFAIFLLGSILAKYMDKSGATISIANKVLSVVGTKNPYNALVALFIISAILTYGGINVFVIIFALIPMAKPIFRELNISWKLVDHSCVWWDFNVHDDDVAWGTFLTQYCAFNGFGNHINCCAAYRNRHFHRSNCLHTSIYEILVVQKLA